MKRCVCILFFYFFVSTLVFANEEGKVVVKDNNTTDKLLNVNTNTNSDVIIKHKDDKQDIIKTTELQQREEVKREQTTTENIKEENIIDKNNQNSIKYTQLQEKKDKIQNIEDKTNIKNKQKQSSKTLSFVDKWLIPEHNPAFGKDGHSIGIQYGYDFSNWLSYNIGNEENKMIHLGVIQYSSANKFLGVHGRTSIGIGYLYGQDYWAVNADEGKYNTPLFEVLQEAVVGNKIYIYAGIGVSWVVRAPQNYEMQGIWKQKNHTDIKKNYQKGGITNLNIPLTIGVGHRFDCGVVLELAWKHYSNGHVADYNSAINTIAIGLRYTFGENRKI